MKRDLELKAITQIIEVYTFGGLIFGYNQWSFKWFFFLFSRFLSSTDCPVELITTLATTDLSTLTYIFKQEGIYAHLCVSEGPGENH